MVQSERHGTGRLPIGVRCFTQQQGKSRRFPLSLKLVDRCPSGLRCRPGKSVLVNSQPGVRISPDPPLTTIGKGVKPIKGPQGPSFLCEKAHKPSAKKHPTSTHVQHSIHGLLSVAQAAKHLNKSSMSVTRWCKSGRLPALARQLGSRTTYQISPLAVEHLKMELAQSKEAVAGVAETIEQHAGYLSGWNNAMEKGLMTGKPFSPTTIEFYLSHTEDFITRYHVLNTRNVEIELLRLSPAQFSRKYKLHKALICFAKYLISQGALPDIVLEEIKQLKPRRHIPPKRMVLDEAGLKRGNYRYSWVKNRQFYESLLGKRYVKLQNQRAFGSKEVVF